MADKIKFYSLYNPPPKEFTPAGDHFLDIFQEEIDKDGKKELVHIGKTNVWDKIQEGKEATLIQNVLKACAMGDYSMLKQQEPVYIDATTFPKTLMESQNIVLKAKQEFENMPKEVREKFDFSAEKYVSEMGTKEFFEKMAPYNDKIAAIEKEGSLKAYNEKVAAQAKFENDVAAAKGGTTE